MSLAKLSPETVARILGLTGASQIRRCQQVCRSLRDVVEKNAFLQYLLELDLSGYSIPPVQRQDINYEEKVAVLRTRRNAWKRTSLSQPFFIPFKSAWIHTTCFIDGMFACGYRPDESLKATDDNDGEASEGGDSSQDEDSIDAHDKHYIRVIHFDQLPSRNRGSKHKYWEHDLGFNAVHFVISPDQDLLVVLEQSSPTNYVNQRDSPRPTLPSGALPEFDFMFGTEDGPASRREDFDIQVYGDLLVVRLGTGEAGLPPYVEVWNWVLGQNLARAALEEDTLQEFGGSLISKNLFAVPYFAGPRPIYRSGEGLYAGLGGLDICYVPPVSPSGRPELTDRVARLSLPKLSRSQDYQTMRLYAVPVRTSTMDYPQSYSKPPAKIYNPALGDYIHLHINVSMRSPTEEKRGKSTSVEGCLAISALLLSEVVTRALGNDFSQENGVEIPWESWCHCACYLSNATLATSSVIDNSGLGVGFSQKSGQVSIKDSSFLSLDFNPRRLRIRQIGKCEYVGDIFSSTINNNDEIGDIGDDRKVLEQAFASCPQTPWYIQKPLGSEASETPLNFDCTDVK